MDARVPLIELHDDEDAVDVDQTVITLDEDIHLYKVPLVTLEDDNANEHPVITIETDDPPKSTEIVLDDSETEEPQITPAANNDLIECATITLDESDVDASGAVIMLEDNDEHADPLMITNAAKHSPSLENTDAAGTSGKTEEPQITPAANNDLIECATITLDESDVDASGAVIMLEDNDEHADPLMITNVSKHSSSLENTEAAGTSGMNFANKKVTWTTPGISIPRPLTSSNKKLQDCKVYHKKCNNKQKSSSHVCLHNDVKSYICDTCKETFTDKNALLTHSKTHSSDKPYVCDICFKAFGDKKVLRMHYNTHTGEKPFACTICDKVFPNTVALRNHYQMHTGEKPYVCDVCLTSFDQKSSLCGHKLDEHHFLTVI